MALLIMLSVFFLLQCYCIKNHTCTHTYADGMDVGTRRAFDTQQSPTLSQTGVKNKEHRVSDSDVEMA